MIDTLTITHNEALNLPHCLRSLQGWTRRNFVVDSGSTDGTPDIARALGAEVVHHPWEGYARQKNWALDHLPFETDWILILDADEEITPRLREDILAVVNAAPPRPENGFFINRLTFFLDHPLRHCGYFPSWNMRLFRRGKGRYEDREVHEHVIIDDPVGYIPEPMLHNDRRGLEHYFAKHNRYSTLEARQLFHEITNPGNIPNGPSGGANLTAETRRRRWLKRHVTHSVPFPGVWRFLYMYVLRLGIFDGRAGFEFCKFIAQYDAMVALKLRTMLAASRNGHAPRSNPEASPRASGVSPAPTSGSATTPAEPSQSPPDPRGLALAEGSDPAGATLRQSNRLTPVQPAPTLPQAVAQPDPRHPQADALRTARPELIQFPTGDWPAIGSVPVSILIPVKNEERNIIQCIQHVLWASQIVVVDSGSTDLTVPLSQAAGADVYQFCITPDGWPKKKNWALERVAWRNEWVMIIDADEHITPALAREIQDVVTGHYQPDPGRVGCGDGYWVNRRFMFMGRWIKGCGYYPSWNVRLFKHRVGRYERIGMLGDTSSGDNEVHEHVILTTGEAGYLRHEFLHYAYPDLTTWIEKHNRYSTWEAHAMSAGHRGGVEASLFGGPIARRRWLKAMAQRLPMRPLLRFLYSYILERGFLDGYPGFVMCRLIAWYEFVSIAKYREMRRRAASAAGSEA